MRRVHDVVDLLSGVDLNALVALDALIRTQSVTRAAEQLGLTQSAMSHTLRRLRSRFDDPLLVRAGAGMALTPRAEDLQGPLHAALVALARVVEAPGGFDPAHARRRFRVCTPDLFDLLVLPPLLEQLRASAPEVDLALVPAGHPRLAAALGTGEIDLGVVPVAQWAPGLDPAAGLVRKTIFEDGYRCFVRRDHPATRRGRLGLKAYARLPHLLVSPTGQGGGLVDPLLEARGLRRRVALRVPGFAIAARLVADTDLVLTAPASLERVVDPARVRSLPCPLEVEVHGIAMVWHERFGKDPAHVWLRETVHRAAKARR